MAIAEQRSIEAFWNELHLLFHAEASNPGGPALPSVCITASNEAQNDAEQGRLAKSVQFENKEERFSLHKEAFRDAIVLRYGW